MISASTRKYKSYPNSRDSPSSQQSRYAQRQTLSSNNSSMQLQNLILEQCRFHIQGGQQASLGQALLEQDHAATVDREHLIHRGRRGNA